MGAINPGLAAGLLLAALALPSPAPAQAPLPGVARVMAHLDDLYRSTSSYARMRMTVVRERGTRELEMEAWSKGTELALVVIRSPAREAGTASLRTEEGLWSYAPRADRLIRIPTGLLSDSWMGSHFTNDDLLRETSFLDDYTAVLSGAREDGVPFIKATLTPRPGAPVVYTRVEFLVTVEGWIPVRTDYFDGERVVRTMRFEEVRRVGGRPIPMRMILEPRERGGERTVVEYLELELDIPVEDELFTRQGLRRAARGGA